MGIWEMVAAISASVLGSSVLSSLATSYFERKKTNAEADAIVSDNAIRFNEQLTKRIEKLEADLEMFRRENLELHKEIASLKTELSIYKAGIAKSV